MMTDKEVLIKAIEIAMKNGTRWGEFFLITNFNEENEGLKLNKEIQWLKSYVLSHDFAKAFWPEPNEFSEDWKFNLRIMVMFENPIDYLRKFIT